MIKSINLGVKEKAIELLIAIKKEKPNPRFIKLLNSNIKELNLVLGRKVFKKDAVFINTSTLYDIMHPVGGKGSHHYHGLTPEEVYEVLINLKNSGYVTLSYDNRYVVITDVCKDNNLFMVAIIETNKTIVYKEVVDKATIVITIYPTDRQNLMIKK